MLLIEPCITSVAINGVDVHAGETQKALEARLIQPD